MIKRNIIFLASTLTIGTVWLTSCKPDDIQPPPPGNESELITTVRLTLTDSADTGNVKIFLFSDPDGEGGNAPVRLDTIRLDKQKTYLAAITFLDESREPDADLTEEIEEEANEHFIGYTPQNVEIEVGYLDQDSNQPPLPIGLSTRWRAGNAGQGSLRVTLKHQPNEKNGTLNPGETDAEVNFPVVIQ